MYNLYYCQSMNIDNKSTVVINEMNNSKSDLNLEKISNDIFDSTIITPDINTSFNSISDINIDKVDNNDFNDLTGKELINVNNDAMTIDISDNIKKHNKIIKLLNDKDPNSTDEIDIKETDVYNYLNESRFGLKSMCDTEGDDVFNRIKTFVDQNDPNDLKRDMKKLSLTTNISNVTNTEENSKAVEHSLPSVDHRLPLIEPTVAQIKFENLLILKTFKRLHMLEKTCMNYKSEYEKYNKYQNMYLNDNAIADLVRDINLNQDSLQNKLIMIQKIITPHKINQELLTFELLFYSPKELISFDDKTLEEMAEFIKNDINRFNLIIQHLLENRSWTINSKDTLNFSLPKNKIIISNTIITYNEENSSLLMHMDMLADYIRRVYKVSMKYTIVDDNKYHFSWIFIVIGKINKESKSKSNNQKISKN